MTLDYQTLESLRHNHPAWRLLASPHAPLIASFLNHSFVVANKRLMSQADLVESLEDVLFDLRDQLGESVFPKSAIDYLNDWAAPEKGWLRRFYAPDSDEVQFDLTPSTEKAIAWLESLGERNFVGTESRLLMLFELLRQLSIGSDDNPETRLQALRQRRAEIDAEIAAVESGELTLLDDTALKDRFMQFNQQARELLSDFREVDFNFRKLDRSVRERIAKWEGGKGELLEAILGERDAIADSDQGNSFQAFWDFLMSSQRQDEFTDMLQQVLALPAISALNPDKRTRRIHYDWLEAGEQTQRTIALLSQQLRRFLDDQAWLENRRIMDILHGIETKTLACRDTLFTISTEKEFTHIDATAASISLPMERRLYNPPIKNIIANIQLEAGDENLDSSALYSQIVIDKAAIAQHIRHSLQNKSQVSLSDLCQMRPLQQGLAELVAYLELAGGDNQRHRFNFVVDESVEELIRWQVELTPTTFVTRHARLPRIIYLSK
ncbi:MAG: flagellar motility protein MotE (MotC chaperone) [Gammaproteobacteria bacterium]|jgi:flagellar motility protein MotE (MotC chaperone)